ncbi:MAG: flagellar biosynthesis protein FlgD, partial [Actinobacteria bacterium]|nr:flagellar biosynthesis protein FlgD [Actinomycetota bacterium]
VLFDRQGDPVRTITGETGAGPHTFVWDGTANDGSALPDAVYDVAIAAVDSDDSTVSTTTGTIGEVTGIEMADGTVVL